MLSRISVTHNYIISGDTDENKCITIRIPMIRHFENPDKLRAPAGRESASSSDRGNLEERNQRNAPILADGGDLVGLPVTMTFSCFVVGKGSSSYTYVEVLEVEGDAIVGTVTRAIQELASEYHSWDSTHVEIELYQVSLNSAFPDPFRAFFDPFAPPSAA